MNNCFEMLPNGIQLLIEFKKQHLAQVCGDLKKFYNESEHAYWWRTIRIDTGRQTGKSHFISDQLNEDTIVICNKEIGSQRTFENAKNVFSLQQALTQSHLIPPFKIAYVDDASRLLSGQQEELTLLKAIARDYDSLFVFLGCSRIMNLG